MSNYLADQYNLKVGSFKMANSRGFPAVMYLTMNGNLFIRQSSLVCADDEEVVPMPGSTVLCFKGQGTMSRDQVKHLIHSLQAWVDEGELGAEKDGREDAEA